MQKVLQRHNSKQVPSSARSQKSQAKSITKINDEQELPAMEIRYEPNAKYTSPGCCETCVIF